MSDGLVLRQRLSERLTLQHVIRGGIQRRTGHADCECSDAGPKEIECLHRDAEAAVDLAEHERAGHERVPEDQPPDRMGGHELQRIAGEARRVARDHESRQPACPGSGRGPREDGVDVRIGRV